MEIYRNVLREMDRNEGKGMRDLYLVSRIFYLGTREEGKGEKVKGKENLE